MTLDGTGFRISRTHYEEEQHAKRKSAFHAQESAIGLERLLWHD